MPFRWNPREHLSHGRYVVKWVLLLTPLSITIGAACALFLWLLDKATATRFAHPWLLYLLPLAGVPMVWVYGRLGRGSEQGNNLIIEEIHKPGGGVPARMAPLVLIATLATHLFGGSAGREGTAVQMGGSIASAYGHLIPRFSHADTRTLLMAGVAGGFAGVFGTPIAGAFFAIEVLALGQLSYTAIIPCLFAAIVADRSCHAFNIHHTVYHLTTIISPDGGWLMLKAAGAAVLFGLASMFFTELTHSLHRGFAFLCRPAILRPLIGGSLIILLVHLLGTRDFLGIGIVAPEPGGVSILSAFSEGGAHPWSWWWKCLFTAITLSVGFKGGEVTPLFFIGATLGNTLAWLFQAPVDLFAALGFVAVFAGATNTPLACTIMAVELFGPQNAVYFAVACFIAYLFSGHTGIYTTQRIGASKSAALSHEQGQTLLTSREQRPKIMALLRRAWSRLNITQGKS